MSFDLTYDVSDLLCYPARIEMQFALHSAQAAIRNYLKNVVIIRNDYDCSRRTSVTGKLFRHFGLSGRFIPLKNVFKLDSIFFSSSHGKDICFLLNKHISLALLLLCQTTTHGRPPLFCSSMKLFKF